MRFKPRRSSPRLPSFDYRGSHAYHLVLTTRDKLRRLEDKSVVSMCLGCLAGSASRYGLDIVAYCFMPEHLHLLAVGDEDASLVRFVQHFRQGTGHRRPGLWQRSFYDHIIRSEEALEDVAAYMWGNPVRAGLVEDAAEYPFSGPREAMMAAVERASHLEDRAEALSLQSGGTE